MPKDAKAQALIAAVLSTIRNSSLPPKDVAFALLSVAAGRAVVDGSFADCEEFESAAHNFFHTALELAEERLVAQPATGRIVH